VNKFWNYFLIFVGGVVLFWAGLPLFYGITHIGVWIPMLLGLFLILYGCFSEKLFGGHVRKHRRCKEFSVLIGVGFGIFLVMSVILSFGFPQFSESVSGEQEYTVVVLGCKAEGEEPSKMLRNRLEAAYELLRNNPSFPCIVTGGQGKDEEYAESEVMKSYLVKKGISSERIYEENQAKNTKENLLLTKAVLEQENLPEEIILVTDFYHQYRGNRDASKAGLTSRGYSCKTDFPFFFSSWCREMIAVVIDWIMG
jgi:uncharacterized SAM-binding protein YcdF (DUF218 family)